jgi:hypothetical protein
MAHEPVTVGREMFKALYDDFTYNLFVGMCPLDTRPLDTRPLDTRPSDDVRPNQYYVHAGGSLHDILTHRFVSTQRISVTGLPREICQIIKHYCDDSRDIDLFTYGEPANQIQQVESIIRHLRAKHTLEITFNQCVIDIQIQSLPRIVQLIMTNDPDPQTICDGFDTSHLMAYYDHTYVWMNHACHMALQTQVTEIIGDTIAIVRACKAMQRNYRIGTSRWYASGYAEPHDISRRRFDFDNIEIEMCLANAKQYKEMARRSDPLYLVYCARLTADPIESDPIIGDPIESDPIESDPIESDPIIGDPNGSVYRSITIVPENEIAQLVRSHCASRPSLSHTAYYGVDQSDDDDDDDDDNNEPAEPMPAYTTEPVCVWSREPSPRVYWLESPRIFVLPDCTVTMCADRPHDTICADLDTTVDLDTTNLGTIANLDIATIHWMPRKYYDVRVELGNTPRDTPPAYQYIGQIHEAWHHGQYTNDMWDNANLSYQCVGRCDYVDRCDHTANKTIALIDHTKSRISHTYEWIAIRPMVCFQGNIALLFWQIYACEP